MDRLTGYTGYRYEVYDPIDTKNDFSEINLQKLIDKLAHYEDLEESGRLVVLPCKVGETVYHIVFENCNNGTCYFLDAGGCRKGGISSDYCPQRVIPITFELADMNRKIYLTREEAEAVLKGESNGD